MLGNDVRTARLGLMRGTGGVMSSATNDWFEHGHDAEEHRPGAVVSGKYQRVRQVGEGALGSVWAARNTALDTNVAIKLLRPGLQSDASAAYLRREARVAAR